MTLHPEIAAVTDRVIERSKERRAAYLAMIARERESGADRPKLGCANLAHAYAGTDEQRDQLAAGRSMNIGIVTAYNDMLSAHATYYRYPEQMKVWAHEAGATAQVAGGVPAMCDGVTQGYQGMELSLFSRDTIALSTAVALSHRVFEGAGAARHLRQDRPRAADRRAALRASADGAGPRRADAIRPAQQGEGSGPRTLCRRQGEPRGAARGEIALIIRRAPAPSTAPPIRTR